MFLAAVKKAPAIDCGLLTMENIGLDETAVKAVEDYWEYTRFVAASDCVIPSNLVNLIWQLKFS